jgi:hypothetical protein
MSKLEVNAVEPQCGTNLTLGASGDTIIIPSGATISNQGTAAGFGPTGAVSWDTTKKTTGFTAVSGVGYFCDTTSAAFTVTLPSSPSAGAVVGICDYANTFATNNITVGRNSSNIGGFAANAILSTNGVSVTFVYVDATQGWIVTDSGNRSDLPAPQYIAATGGTVTTCGDYKIHTFTGPGTFCVSSAGNPGGSTTVDYLVVAGGGGGGAGEQGGGGGAGGFRVSNSYGIPAPTMSPLSNPTGITVTAQGYPITVGGGGAQKCTPQGPGNSGSNSVFSTITSTGGGGGGEGDTPGSANGLNGGSGGGGGAGGGCRNGGTGNTPPTSPSQGNNGGVGQSAGGPNPTYAGGGGGAGAVGGAQGTTPGTSGIGGVGSFVSPSFAVASAGTTGPAPGVRYFSGGGGSGVFGPSPVAPGGSGGGGAGGVGIAPVIPAVAGTTNTGGGGGGGGNSSSFGAAGGSGIVIIRYKFQ